MNAIGAVTSVDFARALALTPITPAAPLPGFSSRRGDLLPAHELLDDVPYAVIEQTAAAPVAGRGGRRAAPAPAARTARAVPRSTRRVASDAPHGALSALAAYAPYEDCLGFYVDVWA